MAKTIGLGRGLDALIPSQGNEEGRNVAPSSAAAATQTLPIDQIRPNPNQPRMTRQIEKLELEDLANSIKEHGIIQPVIVTRTSNTTDAAGQPNLPPYTLIAGERRWRAASLAGLKEVPVIIKDYAPQQLMEIALVENIQRKDLNALEEALAYKQLSDEFGMMRYEVADRVGKSREAVSNIIRLLDLCGQAQQALVEDKISEGHARALITKGMTIENQMYLLDEIIRNKLTVREAEAMAKKLVLSKNAPKIPVKSKHTTFFREYENKLNGLLGSKVNVQSDEKGRGKIVVEFYSEDEFYTIYEKMINHRPY